MTDKLDKAAAEALFDDVLGRVQDQVRANSKNARASGLSRFKPAESEEAKGSFPSMKALPLGIMFRLGKESSDFRPAEQAAIQTRASAYALFFPTED